MQRGVRRVPVGLRNIASAGRRVRMISRRASRQGLAVEIAAARTSHGRRTSMRLYELAPTRSIRVRWTLQELGVDARPEAGMRIAKALESIRARGS
jgi:hypothetical protein